MKITRGNLVAWWSDVKPDTTIQFIYNSGSNPGSIRNVKIENIGSDKISGVDLDKNAFRCFNKYDIASGSVYYTTVVNDVNEFDFVTAREAVFAQLTGEELAELYTKKMGQNAIWDAKSGKVVVKKPSPKFNDINRDDGAFDIVNSNGNTMTIEIFDDYIEVDGEQTETPIDLLNALADHLKD